MIPAHPMLARILVGLFMLGSAFLGLVLTDVYQSGAFRYWQWIAPIYAIFALGLSWYERRDKTVLRPVTIWHELLHWAGMIAAVYLISLYVSWGIVGRFIAALLVLTVLSLSVYLAGVYIEFSFCIIGIVLGLFSATVAFFEQYLYALAVPILIFASALLVWYLLRRKLPLS